MYAQNHSMHFPRALAPRRLAAAGAFVTFALLSAACSSDSVSRINAPPLRLNSNSGTSAAASGGSGPPLGAASGFAVLAGSTVTCTRAATVTGDVGVSPGSAITGFNPDCTITGTFHAADAIAAQAQNDLTTAYNTLAGLPCGTTITADLGGTTQPAGVYCSASSIGVTGTLTLDGGEIRTRRLSSKPAARSPQPETSS